jgi:hypothetical protein
MAASNIDIGPKLRSLNSLSALRWTAMRTIVAALVMAATAQVALDRLEVAGFIDTLRAAIARGDRAAVAARVRYPMTIFASGVRIPIRDAATFAQSYDVVFPAALRQTIAKTAPVVGGEAATIAQLIEIRRVSGELKIVRIDLPAGDAPAGPRAPAPPSNARAEPDRLGIAVGRVQRAGTLAAGGRDRYVIYAQKNRLLDVRIDGVRGQDVVLHVVDAKSGAPLDARAKEGVRAWAGRVPADGDYRIEVERRTPGSDRLPYTLRVDARD